MLPIILDPEYIKALVVGKGWATNKRLKMLEHAGVKAVKHIESFPSEEDFEGINIAYIADFDEQDSEKIAEMARSKNILLNIEDKKKFCDFHVPSMVRRGSLLVAVSTAGKSPRVAKRLKKVFDNMLPENFDVELDQIGHLREKWRSEGDGFDELSKKTDEYIEDRKLFDGFCEKCKKS